MFCPGCGLEDPNQNQFCRSCGTSLNPVRSLLEYPDSVTNSAVTAREEIGRAIAAKIAEFEDARELRQAVYEIIPVIERFLQSPEERRLQKREEQQNQVRDGVLTSVVGIAILVFFLFLGLITRQEKVLIVSALGFSIFLIGLGIAFTARKSTKMQERANPLSDIPLFKPAKESLLQNERRNELRQVPDSQPIARLRPMTSVTEGTTRELRD